MARALVSVVIPTLNSHDELAGCLPSLSEGLSAGLIRELIISDGGSADGTLALADEAGAIVVSGSRSRGGQLRRGCAQAQGAWLLVLHADTILIEGWTADVIQLIESGAGAGYFRLGFRAKGIAPKIVAGWANLRSKLLGLPYGDQGLLIRRSVYEGAGGYPDIPLMEDVALMRALPAKPQAMQARAWTSADKYQRQGWVKRGTLNLLMLLRYLLGAKPETLAREYTGKR